MCVRVYMSENITQGRLHHSYQAIGEGEEGGGGRGENTRHPHCHATTWGVCGQGITSIYIIHAHARACKHRTAKLNVKNIDRIDNLPLHHPWAVLYSTCLDLNLTQNYISKLDGLARFQHLEILHLAFNQITRLKDVMQLRHLCTWMHDVCACACFLFLSLCCSTVHTFNSVCDKKCSVVSLSIYSPHATHNETHHTHALDTRSHS